MRCSGGRLLAAFALSVAVGWLDPASSSAACGDSVLEAAEQCDDGNVNDGDCCSASCGFEVFGSPCMHGLAGRCVPDPIGVCDGVGECFATPGSPEVGCGAYGFGAQLTIRDESGTDRDRMRWNLRPGKWAKYNSQWIPSFGDPTVDTEYTFCLYEMDAATSLIRRVIYERVLAAGTPWESTASAWTYQVTNDVGQPEGEIKARVSNRARVEASGSMAALPGPVSSTEYFDGTGVTGVALVGSKGRCFLHRAGGNWWPPRWNEPTRYRFGARSYVND